MYEYTSATTVSLGETEASFGTTVTCPNWNNVSIRIMGIKIAKSIEKLLFFIHNWHIKE